MTYLTNKTTKFTAQNTNALIRVAENANQNITMKKLSRLSKEINLYTKKFDKKLAISKMKNLQVNFTRLQNNDKDSGKETKNQRKRNTHHNHNVNQSNLAKQKKSHLN